MICINKKCAAELPNDAVYCLKCGRKQIREKQTRARSNGMGTIYKRTGADTWTAEVTLGWKKDKDGNRRRVARYKSGFKTKKDADAYLDSLRQGQNKKAITFSALYEAWSTSAMLKLGKSKQCSYRIAYGKIAEIAYIDISALTIEDLQNCVDDNTNSYYTAKDVKVLFSHLYGRAIAQQYVQINLSRYIELPELEETETVPFTVEEQEAIWQDFASGNDFAGYLLLMIHTGMMPGELLKAKKDMIDWQSQQIVGCGLKTKKRKTTPIILPDLILPVLQRLCDAQDKPCICPLRRGDFYDIFNAYIGLMEFNPEIRPYSCRHSSATALDAAGISPSTIQEIMRHTRYSTTEKYIHKDTSSILAEINAKIKSPNTV